ncbi:hypothetical protein OIU34_33345 [Pararhizobium sp. BT-229]|uniref:hypothetical protein n=1 Tax=Pararhizobium sp. BT-229 TaxID=2986923 RepID=UPI0021F7F29F|nr:hypothetical protein [Pararhizobium sp. BT-229]MCV9966762.1 hypothetical protein [Pararhizobium sp. BT-229]
MCSAAEPHYAFAGDGKAQRTISGLKRDGIKISLNEFGFVGTAGDSVLAEFPSIVHAFNSAVAIQQAMLRANQEIPEDRRMNFRIGIDVGDVLVKR